MEKKLLLIGGGGHCKSVLDSINYSGEYDEIGIVDKGNNVKYQNIPVVGNDDDLPDLYRDGWKYAFVTVGSVGNTEIRHRLYTMIKSMGFIIPVIKDPSAVIAGDAQIEEGSFIGKKAVVNAGAVIGKCAIINTGAIIEHECRIGNFAHISPGTILCGQVSIGDDSHIGAGSVVRQQIDIGGKTMVGAGSVVVKDLPDNVRAFGNPCKVID